MSERGQATVEWAGLALLVSLAMGGLLTVAGAADFGRPARALGDALVERLAQPLPAHARARALLRGAPGAGPPSSRSRPPRGSSPGSRPRAPGPPAGGSRSVRPPSLRYLARGVRPSGRTSRVLRTLARAGEHAWFWCVGYRGLRYDFEHPRSPREFMSPDAVVEVLDKCLNPLGFLLP
jgi:hypothetical protein